MSRKNVGIRAEAIERLQKWLRPGDTIYCILRHVSRSGMLRVIDLVKVDEDGDIVRVGYDAARALGWPYDYRRGGVRVSGCGMDMGFHLVYSLGHALFGAGAGEVLKHRWL